MRGLKLEDKKISLHTQKNLFLVECSVPWWQAFCRHPPTAAGRHPCPYLGDCAHTFAQVPLRMYLRRRRFPG